MKIDAPTRKWITTALLAAAAIVLIGILRSRGAVGPWSLVGTFIAAVAVLLYLAITLANGHPRLNLTLAAETLVAFGIFSLIVSITVVLLNVTDFMSAMGNRDISPEDLRMFAGPFAEGLFAAAIAPFLATLLRHIESNIAATDSTDGGFADAAREAATLAEELKLATSNFRAMNTDLVASKDAFETALGTAVKATGLLSSTLQTEVDRVKISLQRVQAEATGLADASEKSRVAVGELGAGFNTLNSASKNTSDLLDALGKLIESVERYIRPGHT